MLNWVIRYIGVNIILFQSASLSLLNLNKPQLRYAKLQSRFAWLWLGVAFAERRVDGRHILAGVYLRNTFCL